MSLLKQIAREDGIQTGLGWWALGALILTVLFTHYCQARSVYEELRPMLERTAAE